MKTLKEIQPITLPYAQFCASGYAFVVELGNFL